MKSHNELNTEIILKLILCLQYIFKNLKLKQIYTSEIIIPNITNIK